MYDFKGLLDCADSHLLLTIVAAVHHETVGETLDNGAVDLLEALLLILSGGMGNKDLGFDMPNLEILVQRDVFALDVLIAPFSKELGFSRVLENFVLNFLDFFFYYIGIKNDFAYQHPTPSRPSFL